MDPFEANRIKKRCPVCFSREIDVIMIVTAPEQHRCIKCSFEGSENEVFAMYADIRKKYHWMGRRLTMEDQIKL